MGRPATPRLGGGGSRKLPGKSCRAGHNPYWGQASTLSRMALRPTHHNEGAKFPLRFPTTCAAPSTVPRSFRSELNFTQTGSTGELVAGEGLSSAVPESRRAPACKHPARASDSGQQGIPSSIIPVPTGRRTIVGQSRTEPTDIPCRRSISTRSR
jgi:hypothetical protein